MASVSRLFNKPTETTMMVDDTEVPATPQFSRPKTFVLAPVQHLISDTGDDLIYDNLVRGGTMGQSRRFPMPQRKLSLRQGKLDMSYKHKINYRSAYDYDKKTTTKIE